MDAVTKSVIKEWFVNSHDELMEVDRISFDGKVSQSNYGSLEEILVDYDSYETMYFPI